MHRLPGIEFKLLQQGLEKRHIPGRIQRRHDVPNFPNRQKPGKMAGIKHHTQLLMELLFICYAVHPQKPDFTALAALCDCTAKTAICAFAAAGYRTPEDISVIGTEGLNASQYFLPPLTCVGVDLAHYMDTVLDAVEELIRNPEQQIRITEPQKIFERESVKTITRKTGARA